MAYTLGESDRFESEWSLAARVAVTKRLKRLSTSLLCLDESFKLALAAVKSCFRYLYNCSALGLARIELLDK